MLIPLETQSFWVLKHRGIILSQFYNRKKSLMNPFNNYNFWKTNKKSILVVFLLVASGCGKGGAQECSIPQKSFTDCCSSHGGFNYCSSATPTAILFENDNVSCYDGFLTTNTICKK